MKEYIRSDNEIKPNPFTISIIITFGCAIGFLPYLLFIKELRLLYLVTLVSAIIALISVICKKIVITEKPSFWELLLASWSAVSFPATGSIFCLLVYAAFYWGVKLINYLLNLYNSDLSLAMNPSSGAYWTSLAVFAFCTLLTPFSNSFMLIKQLYPSVAGIKSAFYPLINRLKTLVTVAISIVAAIIIMLFFMDTQGNLFPILLAVILVYSSATLITANVIDTDNDKSPITAISEVFDESGYHVYKCYMTGKPEVDPLIQNINLLAISKGKAFALEISSLQTKTEVEWNKGSAVRIAASILKNELPDINEVDPVFVIVGGKIAPSLQKFSLEEKVLLVHFEDPSLFDKQTSREEVSKSIIEHFKAAGMPFPAASNDPHNKES